MDLKPIVTSSPHPLLADGRHVSYAAFRENETLGDYVSRNKIALPRSEIAVFVNGVLLMGDWKRFIPADGDSIAIRSRATGSDGGKVFKMVAMIALVIAAPAVGAWTNTTFGISASLGSSLFMIAGSMLLNALIPPPKPAQIGNRERETSPTYGINGGRNQLSPGSPMIIVMGEHKVVPYYGSKPYTTFSGNDQYLSQVFHFGLQPDLDISNIKIGSTLIDNYQDVEINRSGPDGKLTLVAGNVDTLDGFDLTQPDGWIMRTTPLDTEFISADVAAQLYNISDEGDYRDEKVSIEAQYSVHGANTWKPLGGQYEVHATHYWSLGSWVQKKEFPSGDINQVWQQIEYGSTNPADHTEMQAEQRCVDRYSWLSGGLEQVCTTYYWRWVPHPAAGWLKKPWQGIAPDPVTTYTGTGISELKGSDPQKPARTTMEARVAKGQYDIRFRKVTGDVSTNQRSNKLSVAQIRCTQTDEADYQSQLRMAVRIKATSQLNGAIETLSALCRAKCPVWKNNAWVEEYTSNPAWWFLWFARGMRDTNFDRLYGECLPDSKIDIEAIKAWATFCDHKNLTFNWVLDRKMSIEEVYYTIARAGRASTTWQSGKRGVIWDSAGIPVTTLVTPANIIAGSYQYSYINNEVADEIIVNFVNRDKDYEPDTVRQVVPGTARVNNPITLDLEGCDNPNMAGREANLLSASQHFHRKRHTWEMDLEGMICTRGDVVQFTHDLNEWGSSGRVLAINGGTLTLDGYVAPASTGWMSLRAPDNTVVYVRTLASGTDKTDTVSIHGGWPAGFPTPDGNELDYIWQYSPTETPGKKLHITSVTPKSNGNVQFEAIEYSQEYYESENDPFIHIGTSKPRPALINVFGISATERIIDEPSGTVDVTFTWTLSEKSDSDVTIYINGSPYDSFSTNRYMTTVSAREGDVIDIEVFPTKDNRGIVSRYQYTVRGTLFVIPSITSLTTASEVYAIRLNWTIPAVNYIERTEIWYSEQPQLNTAQKLTELAYPQQSYVQSGIRAGQEFYYWVRLVDRFGNIGDFYPTGNGVYGVSSTDVNAYMELFKDEFVSSAVGQQLQDEIDIINGDALTAGSIAAAVKAEANERMDSDIALAEAIDTVEAVANGAAASAQTNATAIAGVDGRLSSTITTKVQILGDGQRVIAGTGLGIEYTPDQGFQSSFNVWADRFAVWSGNGTDLFSPFVVSGGQVFINDAVIGTLSADKIGAGIIEVGKDGYGLIRRHAKGWRDGGSGFFFEGQPNGRTVMEMTAGNSYFWLDYQPSDNSSTGAININNSFYADHTGYMRINAVDVLGRLQVQGDSVTTMNRWAPSGWSNAVGQKWSVNLGEGAGAMVAFNLRVQQTGGLLNMVINLILNGVTIGRVDGNYNPSSGWQCWAGSFPSNATLQITHEGNGTAGDWWLDVSVLKRFR